MSVDGGMDVVPIKFSGVIIGMAEFGPNDTINIHIVSETAYEFLQEIVRMNKIESLSLNPDYTPIFEEKRLEQGVDHLRLI